MAKTLTEVANEYATSLAGGPLRDQSWNYVQRDFLAGAAWMRDQFMLLGTDDCKTCEMGRATIYVTLGGECIECHNKKEN